MSERAVDSTGLTSSLGQSTKPVPPSTNGYLPPFASLFGNSIASICKDRLTLRSNRVTLMFPVRRTQSCTDFSWKCRVLAQPFSKVWESKISSNFFSSWGLVTNNDLLNIVRR